jgi:CSLREA domain-containing protein
LVLPPAASAANFEVNLTVDGGDGTCDDTCTLRDAIGEANANAGADLITFSGAVTDTIVLGSALPTISEDLTIDGSGQTVTVDGASLFRVFSATVPLTLTALTVQNGSATGNGGGAYFGDTATVSGTTFISNTAAYGAGAWFSESATVADTTFIGNTAGKEGGGARFDGTAILASTTFRSNTANGTGGGSADGGGGAYFASTAIVSGTTFISNTAFLLGGGALFVGQATLTGTTFISNTSNGGGGAMFRGPAELAGTAFISNTATAYSGGAYFGGLAAVTGTVFINNSAPNGGGASFVGGAVTGSTFISNTATSRGGGVLIIGNNSVFQDNLFRANSTGGDGGGIYISLADNVRLNANRIIDNQAVNNGGGIHLDVGDANLDNNIIAANSVLSSTGAAEIGLQGVGTTLTGRHNTLASATPGSGTAVRTNGDLTQTIRLTNTVFEGYAVAVQAGAFTPAITLDGVLWSGVTLATQGGITVSNAYTGLVAFVNPPTRDYHLALSSAAREAAISTALIVDFEGDSRPIGLLPDLGADEYRVLTPLAPAAVDDTASTPEDTAITLDVLANDSDLNGDTLSVSAVGTPSSGAATISGTTQIAYTPALNFNGAAVLTYIVSDGALTNTARVTVTVIAANDPPTVSALGDLTITVSTSTGPISFTVGDVEAGGAVTVTAASGNLTLVPNTNILLGGSGTSRTVTVTPAASQTGTALITLTVSDGQGGTAQESFVLTVISYRLFLPLLMR